jgi:6-phosphogluconolactonase
MKTSKGHRFSYAIKARRQPDGPEPVRVTPDLASPTFRIVQSDNQETRVTVMLNRRHFLTNLAAAAVASRLPLRAEVIRNAKFVLLGTDKGKGIYRASWNPLTGEIGTPSLAAPSDRPTYFARHPKRSVLYTANEAAQGDGSLSAFRLDEKTADLEPLQVISSKGGSPCYISVDETGHSVFAANYTGGSVAAVSLKGDGSFASDANLFACKDNADCGILGPNTDRQEAPHMHCAVLSPDNRWLIACNLGEDAIEVFPIDPVAPANEILGTPKRFAARSGSGPRHVVFHPNGRWLYCIHELDCTIDVYGWEKGKLTPLGGGLISTLASDADLPGATGCEIVIDPKGRFVYANTRGENSLVVYKVNEKTGFLTEQQRVQTGGTVTRVIAFDPTHRWLLCMNQGSSTISVFGHDPKTGKLTTKPTLYPADTPMCVEWV